jgi:hypothetical protein
VKTTVFCNVTPCTLADLYRYFGGIRYLDLQCKRVIVCLMIVVSLVIPNILILGRETVLYISVDCDTDETIPIVHDDRRTPVAKFPSSYVPSEQNIVVCSNILEA